jgi:hypothetical protein
MKLKRKLYFSDKTKRLLLLLLLLLFKGMYLTIFIN